MYDSRCRTSIKARHHVSASVYQHQPLLMQSKQPVVAKCVSECVCVCVCGKLGARVNVSVCLCVSATAAAAVAAADVFPVAVLDDDDLAFFFA